MGLGALRCTLLKVPLGEVGQATDMLLYVFLAGGLPLLLGVVLAVERLAKWVRQRLTPAGRRQARP
jgi:hypothetical protein